MNHFADLLLELSYTNASSEKTALLARWLKSSVDDRDKVWAIALLSGHRPRRSVSNSLLRHWVMELTGYPEWLLLECHQATGDWAETLALLVSGSSADESLPPLFEIMQQILRLQSCTEEQKHSFVSDWWHRYNRQAIYVLHKLLGSSFRIGISEAQVLQALSEVSRLEPGILALRLSGKWDPEVLSWQKLIHPAQENEDPSRPYPFCLAHPIPLPDMPPEPEQWLLEWKWDGIRAQIVKRNTRVWIWSRSHELLNESFPELSAAMSCLPDGSVLDGEIRAWQNDRPLPFGMLQKRIGKKKPGPALQKSVPVIFMAYDLLESGGEDLRLHPLEQRKSALAKLPLNSILQQSPFWFSSSWEQTSINRLQAAEKGAEGLMVKHKESPYHAGRKRGLWWKWKRDPFSLDAVLVAAKKGTGRRAGLFTDYSFALRRGEGWVTFASAYSGLTDAEIKEVDQFIRKNVREKFGPVRTLDPFMVFEIGFEGINRSSRHKCGAAVRFPRILRIRRDKLPEDANSLQDLLDLLAQQQA